MITITEAAAKAIANLTEKENKPMAYLRLGVSGGGCSGFNYTMDLVEARKDSDQVFEKNGARVVVDPRSLKLLDGMHLDYEKTFGTEGFKFKNPNAKSTCGCGTSFSIG